MKIYLCNCCKKLKENCKCESNSKKINSKFILPVFIFILSMFLVGAITITQIQPTGDIVTSNSSVLIEYNFSTDYLNNLTFSWDNTNYSLYDDSLVLFMNFDNRSALGENSTHVKDLSKYGNNGTVVGGSNISWTPSGKFSGAFNFSGNKSDISTSIIAFNNSNQQTINVWIKPNIKVRSDVGYIFSHPQFGTIGNRVYILEDTDGSIKAKSGNISATSLLNPSQYTLGDWIFVTLIRDATNNRSLGYLNGQLRFNLSSDHIGGYNNINSHIGSSDGTVNFFNGSIDEIMIFNRSLSSNEINQLYKSQLTKHDLQNWIFQTNQSLSLPNSTTTSINFLYQTCVSNSTTQVCSPQQIITQNIPISTIITNFTNITKNIGINYWGVNTHGTFGSNLSFINLEGVRTPSDYLWHQEKMREVNIRRWIADMALASSSINETNFNETANLSNLVNINTRKYIVKYAKENNIKITFIADQVPEWNRNKTSSCSSDNSTCLPINFTAYANNVVNFLVEVGCNAETCDVIVYNEPYDKLLINESRGSINISNGFNQIYNSTYDAIKLIFPDMDVGANVFHFGYGTITYQTYDLTNRYDYFIANFTGRFDFLAGHGYKDDTMSSSIIGELANVKTICTSYGEDCDDIRITEINYFNSSIQNTTNLFYIGESYLSSGFVTLLNIPYITSIGVYQWSDINSYSDTIQFGNYPHLFSMVSEPQLDNAYYPPYNVTKSFAHLCPAGSTVYSSSSDDDTIKVVTCKDSNKYNIIIINTDTVSKNVSLSQLPSITNGRLVEYETSNYIPLSSSINLGVMDGHEIVYLSTDECPYPQTLTEDGLTCEYAVETGCNTFTRTGYNLVMIFASLIIIYFAGSFVWSSYQNGNLDLGKLIIFFITIIVCLVLWTASGQNLYNSCGTVG